MSKALGIAGGGPPHPGPPGSAEMAGFRANCWLFSKWFAAGTVAPLADPPPEGTTMSATFEGSKALGVAVGGPPPPGPHGSDEHDGFWADCWSFFSPSVAAVGIGGWRATL